MMNPPWFLGSRKGAKTPRNSAPVARSRFIPRLEALEDRSLLSVVPVVTFLDGTIGQPIANQSSSLTSSPQPTASNTYDLNITLNIAYSGSTIGFVSYISSSSSVNGFTINVPASNGTQLALVSGNTNYIALQNPSQIQTTSWQWIQIQVNLSSASADPVASNLSRAVALVANDAAAGTTLQFTLANSNTSGSTSAGTVMFFGLDSPGTTPMVNNPSGSAGGTSPSSAWYFSNPHGPSALTITLANLNFFALKTSTGQTEVAGYAVYSVSDSSQRNLIVPENNLSSILGNYFAAGGISGQPVVMPRSTASNSLLAVGGTTPGFYLTLSITRELSPRSSGPSAQATWTGLRPPLEAPLANPRSASIKLGFGSSMNETNSADGTVPSLPLANNNNHTMEQMVSNILVSLQLTEADHQAKDIAQANELSANDPESQTSDIFFAALGLEPRADSVLLGNSDDSLNQLLEEMALTDAVPLDAVPLRSEMHQPEQDNDAANVSTKATIGWGWRVLGECMATVLLALYWPGAICPQAPGSKESKSNCLKLTDPSVDPT
jgi:hypothetical protein